MDQIPQTAHLPGDSRVTGDVYLYFGSMTLLVYLVLPNQYLLDIATAYLLKDRLHATALEIASFRLLTAIPVYISFIFGLARDIWNPFGLRDRGLILIFAPATAAVFVFLAFFPLSYTELFAGMLLAMITFRFVAAAYQGLMALTSQEKLMSGRMSALWQTVAMVAIFIGGIVGGYVAGHLSYQNTFLLIAALTLSLAALGMAKPKSVFSHLYDRPQARGTSFIADIRRLVKHRAVYPPVLITLLFQFSPGLYTPMQFYLTNALHASRATYGEFSALISLAFLPAFLLYGFLCRKFPLKRLLWIGAIITIPQNVPLALVHSGNEALMLAVPMGLLGGIAVGAYFDLTMRSCPPGLQGSLMMMVDGIGLLSLRASDFVGSAIYDASPQNGFLYCVILTTAVYMLVLPVLLLIPQNVVSTADGQPPLQLDMTPGEAAAAE